LFSSIKRKTKLKDKSNEIERVKKISRGSRSTELNWNSRGGGGNGCKTNKCDHPEELWIFSGTTKAALACIK